MRANALRLLAAAMGVYLAATPVRAHHEMAAEFDDRKPVTLRGVVTKYEWNNPHVYVFVDARVNNETANWALEFAGPSDLRKAGWTRDSVKVGDAITIEGSLARDGSKTAGGKTLTLPGGKKLSTVSEDVISAAPKSAARPTPRWPDGHPRLGTVPGEKGYWAHPSAASLADNTAGNIRMNASGLLANIADAGKVAPFQPWAKGLYEYRQRTLLKDDPMASCLPPGGPRQFQAPHGLQILEQPDRQRVFVLSGGGNRNWRLIDLDGRALPQSEDVSPTYFGYSSGKWDGDTLVVDSVGYVERFWFSNGGLPHTESLKLTERISRPDFSTLKYEVTVNDPATYTRPWTSGWTLQWTPNEDIEEYYCQDNPRDAEHLLGQ
ncbi:MAG: hypothetical protein C5B51_03945 [Terriglobia bacterium]|nr:MAG: hypothetical protein C5B51_03945 [Terriglobia bacterium]